MEKRQMTQTHAAELRDVLDDDEESMERRRRSSDVQSFGGCTGGGQRC
jgi:hypothetical protein